MRRVVLPLPSEALKPGLPTLTALIAGFALGGLFFDCDDE